MRHLFPTLMCPILALGANVASAQDYPTRPIRFIVASSPGVTTDIVARIIAPEMSKLLGQPVIVENKTGSALIGYEYVAKQVPADGYTLSAAHVTALTTLPVTVKDLRFDPVKDLPPIVGLAKGRFVFGGSSKVPWSTFREMVAFARANPGKVNFGAPSSSVRLPTEALMADLKLNTTHVPYSAGGAYMQALAANEVQLGFVGEGSAVAFGDKFRPIAITGEQRSATFPDVPTFKELGHPQIPGIGYALNAPVGIPKIAIEKLHAAASRALQQPDVRARFAKLKLEVVNESPEATARSIAEEAKLYADIARQVGLQPQ